MKMKNMINNRMTMSASSMSSQNWIQARSISVKRTSGARRYYQKIQSELGEYEQNSRATGENIMDLVRNFKYLLNDEGQIITKEKLYDSAEPKEKCPTLKQRLSSIMKSFSVMSGTTNS